MKILHAVLVTLLVLLVACSSPSKIFVDRNCVKELNLLADQRTKAETLSGKIKKGVSVGLKPDQISNEFQLRRDKLMGCYDEHLKRKEGEEGKLLFRLLVNGDGKVEKACIAESNFEDLEFQACVTNHVRAIHFPSSSGGVSVMISYPFIFRTN